jgi:hypothetical protein
MTDKQITDAEQHERNAIDYDARAETTEALILRYEDEAIKGTHGILAKWERMLKSDRKLAAKARESARRLRIMDRLDITHWKDVPQNERG